ncbi:MAG: MFS transporter [Armatimonadetes bacterium]|nr:MFS transporter [Armatimonadota bacterium]
MPKRELPLLLAIFLDLVGFGMAFPDIQLRAQAFGAPGWLIGALLSSYFVTQFVVSPQWGRFSDRIGRKPVLLACTALSALSMVVYAYADNVWIILFSRLLSGLAAANVVVGQAYLADITPESERRATMGRVNSAILLGLVSGPAIGGELAARGGNYLMGLAAAAASTASLLWIVVGVRSMPVAEMRSPGSRRAFGFGLLAEQGKIRRLFFVYSAGWLSLACLEGTFGRLIQAFFGFGQREFGYIFGYESLLGAATGVFLAWITRRVGAGATVRLGYVMQSVGLGLNPLAPFIASNLIPIGVSYDLRGFIALMLASTIYAFGTGIANPTVMSTASVLAPSERQGELFGLLQAARSAGFFVGPILGGVLFDVRPWLPYALAAASSMAAAVLVPTVEGAGDEEMKG